MIEKLRLELENLLEEYGCRELPEDGYTHMKYPKLVPLMYFHVKQYRLEGFGNMMIMHTVTKMKMELLTVSVMPGEGRVMPFALIDAMTMKDKRCVFVEYYGCSRDEHNDAKLKEVYDRYKHLEDYPEKDKWYVHERQDYSLIKKGSSEELVSMAVDSLKAYLDSIKGSKKDDSYKNDLKAFRERMIVEGNPSSSTLNMLLGKDGARKFMEDVVMPVND